MCTQAVHCVALFERGRYDRFGDVDKVCTFYHRLDMCKVMRTQSIAWHFEHGRYCRFGYDVRCVCQNSLLWHFEQGRYHKLGHFVKYVLKQSIAKRFEHEICHGLGHV